MVDGDAVITDEMKTSGAALLRATDQVGFGANGAAWMLDELSRQWYFLLLSPLIDSKGPKWVYDRLLSVFSKLSWPPGLSPLNIIILSPREVAFANYPVESAGDGDGWNNPSIENITINDLYVAYMSIYRFRAFDTNAGKQAKKFDRGVRELLAA